MQVKYISASQLFLMIFGFLFGSTAIINTALEAKNDAWITIVAGAILGGILLYIYSSIALLNPSKTLVEILQDHLGKYFGTAASIFYIWYFIHLASLVFRNFGEFLVTVTYPETPMPFIIVLFAIVIIYAVNSGIEVMARLCELFVPILPIILVILLFSLFTCHDFTSFLPILENGITPVIKATFSYITFPFGETVVFLMVFPHLNNQNKLFQAVSFSILARTICCLIIFFRDISVLGSNIISHATFVPHITSMLIPHVNLEPLIDIALIIGGGIKISICIYAASLGLAQIMGIKEYSRLTSSITLFCVVLSIWVYENITEMFYWAKNVWPFYSIPFQIIIPIIILISSIIKTSRNKIPAKNKLSEGIN